MWIYLGLRNYRNVLSQELVTFHIVIYVSFIRMFGSLVFRYAAVELFIVSLVFGATTSFCFSYHNDVYFYVLSDIVSFVFRKMSYTFHVA